MSCPDGLLESLMEQSRLRAPPVDAVLLSADNRPPGLPKDHEQEYSYLVWARKPKVGYFLDAGGIYDAAKLRSLILASPCLQEAQFAEQKKAEAVGNYGTRFFVGVGCAALALTIAFVKRK